jgi:hypothetical protein
MANKALKLMTILRRVRVLTGYIALFIFYVGALTTAHVSD